MARTVDVPTLVADARAGRPRAVARLISLVEDEHPALREVMAALAPHAGRAHVIGLTGSPGVGKSTSTNALVAALRARGQRVGVLAVDPSSPFSGGALLGESAGDGAAKAAAGPEHERGASTKSKIHVDIPWRRRAAG